MVDIAGHLGVALIVLSPLWFLHDRRVALTFIVIGVPFGLLPDIDLLLKQFIPTIHHHGITHTILFVTVVSGIATVVVVPPLFDASRETEWFPIDTTEWVPIDTIEHPYRVTFGTFWIASLSHLFMDMLASPDIKRYEPIEPFWPLFQQPVTIDLIYYSAFLFTWGLLIAGIVITFAFWWWHR